MSDSAHIKFIHMDTCHTQYNVNDMILDSQLRNASIDVKSATKFKSILPSEGTIHYYMEW